MSMYVITYPNIPAKVAANLDLAATKLNLASTLPYNVPYQLLRY